MKLKNISEIIIKLKQAESSFNALCQFPLNSKLEIKEFNHNAPFILYIKLIHAIIAELTSLTEIQDHSSILNIKNEKYSISPDSIDYLNELIHLLDGKSLSDALISGILDIMTGEILFDIDTKRKIEDDKFLYFQIQHAECLTSIGITSISDYIKLSNNHSKTTLSRLRPDVDDFLLSSDFFKIDSSNKKKKIPQDLILKLRNRAEEVDIFNGSRIFRYSDDQFYPATLAAIRDIDKFYGYRDTKKLFMNFFSQFSQNKENFPLLISSLPGLGKTHFTIAHTLAFENLTLILPEPTSLSTPLEQLIRTLSLRKNKKFVIFFDDVDTRTINWFFFRTHVGGSFVLPDNIAIVIASNYQFPANISSRGRGVTFPIFDEIECQKMVEDYLSSKGMKQPPSSLISVIAADYIEEFGQKNFEELSPRTLVRYLDRYENNSSKRLKMLNLSKEELIAKPDPQLFFEANKNINDRLQEMN